MNDNHVNLQATEWMKLLMTHVDKSFPKIRIRSKCIKPSAASKLINVRNNLIKTKQEDSEECKIITTNIADILAEESKSKAYEFRKYCDQGNTLNVTEMWKLNKKLWPKKKCAIPVAKRNHKGKMISSPSDLRTLLLKEYKERLRARPCRPHMKDTLFFRSKLIKMKLKVARKNKTKPFEMHELEKVLLGLCSGKARDPSGISREIFQLSKIGSDLKNSLLVLCNKVKNQGKIPEFMLKTTISTIPKKGKRTELKNERGIFLVNSVRGVLMRLLFDSEYEMINDNMSDSNIGGRKNKSCINNLWVINSIIHNQLSDKSNKPILFQQYDYMQMFDSKNLNEACSDLRTINYKCFMRQTKILKLE